VTGLSCRQIVEMVTDYVEERMPLPERMRFEQHLAYCAPCKVYLDQMRETIRISGSVQEESLPPDEREKLVALFRGWKARK